jgi:hypothetical protein
LSSLHDFGSIVPANAEYKRKLAVVGLDNRFDDKFFFVAAQCCRFGRRSQNDKIFDPAVDLVLTIFFSASVSTEKSFLNGVTSATPVPISDCML